MKRLRPKLAWGLVLLLKELDEADYEGVSDAEYARLEQLIGVCFGAASDCLLEQDKWDERRKTQLKFMEMTGLAEAAE